MIKGLDEALAELRSLQGRIPEVKKQAELTVANRIAETARSAAPGSLANGIFVEQDGESTVVVGGTELAAYNEFGTGVKAEAYLESQPESIREEALKFYVDGSGKIPARPFFIPAIRAHEGELFEEIEKELSK